MPTPNKVSLFDNDFDRHLFGLPSIEKTANIESSLTNLSGQLDVIAQSYNVDTSNFGNRSDGTPKGRGFLGVLERPDGKVSTELSISVNIDGKEMEIPSLVPTLKNEEVKHLLSGGEMTKDIVGKAVNYARDRMKNGLGVYRD